MTTVNLNILLLFLVFSMNAVLSYKSMHVESGELCSPITKRKIKLGKHEDSALLVSQKRLDDHSLKWKVDFKCTFEIDVSSHSDGVFAVIQKLILRKNETTNECIDYIQFKRDDGSNISRHCGYLNAELSMGKHFAPYPFSSDLAPTGNSYIDPKGKLIATIFVSREPLLEGEETDFLLVFTSYKSCMWNKQDYLPCLPHQTDKCIYVGFFHDGYVNCPYPGCVDENECSPENRSVLISGPVPTSVGSQSGPYATSTALSTEENKDLPPSYESLFPDR
ncbi:uncharacterized protein LOC108741543 isoform X1 [Agrilus planipennis]|uniref:Uncharacterized protein LOC108741543 isoform X1 n=1 Tax=Agrilus planipennis TaxID=224129 RepID=A0A7F5REZ6_AGRPL|nr:uncharacterized protein LOC108741543 isoform X1 [Agrilus planipennis]XP_025834559.1 uncharacterized protein LOC108741543 isoform X1 [Agrilus planipennis]XP_025834560.1 uncharacterized protein LOC108741543 isoform X1 [Agrilus planipennis]